MNSGAPSAAESSATVPIASAASAAFAPAPFGANAARTLPAERWQSPAGYTMTVRYALYSSLTAAMDDQSAGSIDAMLATMPDTGLETMLVELHIEAQPTGKAALHFITTVQNANAAPIEKTWAPAAGNGSGTYRALITVPPGASRVLTRPAPTEATG